MRQNILLPGLVGASLVAAMMLAPVLASAVSAITSAKIESDKTGLEVKIGTASDIATDGSDGAFGYGVLNGGDSLMVATTHGGVLDSATQSAAGDPVWHNHYVQLTAAGEYCAPNAALGGARLEVAALTFESPGEVKVNGASIKMEDLPGSFTGTNPLDAFNEITMNPGTSADTVVSFTLNVPAVSDFHVCVENVTPFTAETD
jgi:hypothetical protein